ncbi:MAG: 30S ribosomal protein S10 [Candidatus Melainabacteria bacterium]
MAASRNASAQKQAPKAKRKVATTKRKQTKQNRVRIRLSSFDHRLIDASAQKIVDVAQQAQGKVIGPIPLPTEHKVFCVLRSPHADKKSREHFELRTHKRVLDIVDPGADFAAQLSRLDLPAGVDIEIRL